MNKKIYGVPVATPFNPEKVKPKGVVKTVNDVAPDENGNVAIDVSEDVNEALAQAKASGAFDGDKGADGTDGKDGVSPVVSVSDITGGHRVTITDANGAKTFDVMDGEDGVGGGGAGVHIGTEAPTDENVTLWLDTDEEPEASGSGSGGGADLLNEYGFLKQSVLPPYYGYGEITQDYDIYIGRNDFVFNEDLGVYTYDKPIPFIIPSETYKVNYNRVEYSCVAMDGGAMGDPGTVFLGNVDAVAGTGDNGIPFVFVARYTTPDSGGDNPSVMLLTLDGELTNYFQIVGNMFKPTAFSKSYSPATPLYVYFTVSEDGTLSASHDFNEAYSALSAKRQVIGIAEGNVFYVTSFSDSQISLFRLALVTDGADLYVITWVPGIISVESKRL